MSITNAKILVYEKNNHIQIHVDKKLVSNPRMAYFRGAVMDMENAFISEADLLSLCELTGVEALHIECEKLVLSTDVGVDWRALLPSLKDQLADVLTDADIQVEKDCEFPTGYICFYDLYRANGA